MKPAIVAIIASGAVVAIVLSLVFLSSSLEFGTGPPSPADTTPVSALTSPDDSRPTIADPSLKAELVADDLDFPTSMAFVDNNGTILALEKNTGKVIMISGGVKKPILELSVAKGAEQGLLGITVEGSTNHPPYVFLYLTEISPNGNNLLGNRIYRYEWDAANAALVHPKLVLDLPAIPGPTHNGGKMTIGKNGELFAVIGDLNRDGGPLGNKPSGEIDDTSVIIRMDVNGEPLPDNPFVSYGRRSMDYYYAYGIRNSFGLDVDPLTGVLWETENGPDRFDELNVVPAGFNSGWKKLTGPMSLSNVTQGDLFHLDGSKYADPVFSWRHSVGVTDIEFFTSDKLGDKYKDNIFVGDYNAGQLYYFKVNKDRNGVQTTGDLSDHIADSYDESLEARLGLFPGGIVDLETGPDGYLYVLTFTGKVYRLVPSS